MKFQLCPCVAMQNCFKAQFSVPKAVELIANNSRTIWQLVKKKYWPLFSWTTLSFITIEVTSHTLVRFSLLVKVRLSNSKNHEYYWNILSKGLLSKPKQPTFNKNNVEVTNTVATCWNLHIQIYWLKWNITRTGNHSKRYFRGTYNFSGSLGLRSITAYIILCF